MSCVACVSVRDSFIANDFTEVKPYWHRIEVPCGCGMEIQIMFTYQSGDLRDPKSG